jgi:hypothetical protein
MKPKPFSALNHFTVPLAILFSFEGRFGVTLCASGRRDDHPDGKTFWQPQLQLMTTVARCVRPSERDHFAW